MSTGRDVSSTILLALVAFHKDLDIAQADNLDGMPDGVARHTFKICRLRHAESEGVDDSGGFLGWRTTPPLALGYSDFVPEHVFFKSNHLGDIGILSQRGIISSYSGLN